MDKIEFFHEDGKLTLTKHGDDAFRGVIWDSDDMIVSIYEGNFKVVQKNLKFQGFNLHKSIFNLLVEKKK